MEISRFTIKCTVIVWVLMTVSYFYSPVGNRVGSDGNYYYHYLVSLMEDGDVDFSNNYSEKNDQYRFRNIQVPTTRMMPNTFYIGPALIWAVPYLSIKSVMKLMGQWQTDESPWSPTVQSFVMYSSVCVGVFAFVLLTGLGRRWFDERAVVLGAALGIFGTNIIWYIVNEPSMSHIYDWGALLAAVFFLQRYTDHMRTGDLVASGASFGFSVCMRLQNVASVLIASLFLWMLLRRMKVANGVRAKSFLIWAGLVIIFSLPHFATFKQIYGDAFAQAYRFVDPNPDIFFMLSRPMMSEVLFSWHNGMFAHHPVWFLGVLGLLISVWQKKASSLWLFLVLIFAVQLYLNSCVIDWWSGHSFGQRRMIGVSILLLIGLMGMLAQLFKTRRGMQLAGVIVASAILWNVWLANKFQNHWEKNVSHNLLKEIVRDFE